MGSNLHLCLRRNGLNVLPKEESVPGKKKFIPLDLFILTVQKVRTDQGKYHLFVAIERSTKYVYVEMHSKISVNESSAFLKNLITHCIFQNNEHSHRQWAISLWLCRARTFILNTTGFLLLQNSFNSEGPNALLFLRYSPQSFIFLFGLKASSWHFHAVYFP
ncbi:hypothetical protein P618_200330 [Holospora obtusa F1]|uniref:Uncharacterized protein n=1 Tax=Holospora obtusa F1 TaxID=1399147 RepID=W6TEA0_HOLOB|nr:hypothetical protein P618_200330 [Holospora obtusa F1]